MVEGANMVLIKSSNMVGDYNKKREQARKRERGKLIEVGILKSGT